jgi:hypothetical protein
MSRELYWELTKNASCFLVKRGVFTLSSDPYNINNEHTYKSSGSLDPKGVSVSLDPDTKGTIVVKVKSARRANNPSKVQIMHLKKGYTSSAATLKAILENNCKNPKMVGPAAKRVNQLLRSQNTPKPMRVRKLRGSKAVRNVASDSDDMEL